MPMKSGKDKTRCRGKFYPPQSIAAMKKEVKCSTIADNIITNIKETVIYGSKKSLRYV